MSKTQTAPVTKHITARMDSAHTKDLGDGVVEVIVSTNNLDRHGEHLDIEGLDLSKYNGIVLLNHEYGSLPIGKSVMLKKQTTGGVQSLISQTQFAINEYPLAKTVYELVKGGYMPDVSIGFIAYMWDGETDTWVKSEMIEYSHVTVGANPDAKVTAKALASVNKTVEQFDDEVKDAIAADKLSKKEAKAARVQKMNNDLAPELVAQLLQVYNAIEGAEDGLDIVEACIENAETILETLLGIPDDDAADMEMDSLMGRSLAIIADKQSKMADIVQALKSLTSAFETQISAATEAEATGQNDTRRIKLVAAKKTAQGMDKVAELLIGELKARLN